MSSVRVCIDDCGKCVYFKHISTEYDYYGLCGINDPPKRGRCAFCRAWTLKEDQTFDSLPRKVKGW